MVEPDGIKRCSSQAVVAVQVELPDVLGISDDAEGTVVADEGRLQSVGGRGCVDESFSLVEKRKMRGGRYAPRTT